MANNRETAAEIEKVEAITESHRSSRMPPSSEQETCTYKLLRYVIMRMWGVEDKLEVRAAEQSVSE